MRTSFWTVFIALVCLSVLVQCGVVRKHYIAADEVLWNYAPEEDLCAYETSFAVPNPDSLAPIFFTSSDTSIGGVYMKATYNEYTDDTFTTIIPKEEWYGILGPTIWAEEGDTIEIVFKNNARFNFSIHPHAIFYTQENAGTFYGALGEENAPGNSVPTGGVVKYTWYVPARAAPLDSELSSMYWPYHSSVNEQLDTNAGLVGGVVVTRKGEAKANGRPKGVAREFVTLYHTFDENNSAYTQLNFDTYLNKTAMTPDIYASFPFILSNWMHAMNGLLYCNLHGFTMYTGEKVRWYTFTQGGIIDFHTSHWHAHTFVNHFGRRLDVVNLFPYTVEVTDMVGDDAGVWYYHCHLNSHIAAGMAAMYTVLPSEDYYAKVRNFATLFEPFAYLFHSSHLKYEDSQTLTLNSAYLGRTPISDPFSSDAVTTAPLVAFVLICLVFVL